MPKTSPLHSILTSGWSRTLEHFIPKYSWSFELIDISLPHRPISGHTKLQKNLPLDPKIGGDFSFLFFAPMLTYVYYKLHFFGETFPMTIRCLNNPLQDSHGCRA
ncbi:hypothetical protein NPIL_535931 [Nephila pilipes]|uniref:Uncharacterized protein n=1 Tax=Nephila pilipes TaxID=299642 RepID=A0A8X6TJJ3_NEPPI|nr:hypothetical protein NPIL_535931 [Nephila pilipes]